MFNRKFLSGLAYTLGGLLMVKAVFVVTMFVWGYFGQPPLALFNPGASQILNYILLLQELGSILFFFVAVGLAKWLIACQCDCKPSMEKRVAAAIAPIKKAAASAKRKVTR